MTHVPGRQRMPATSSGTLTEAFGAAEWSLLVAIALMWGSSFLWMDIGLESLRPGVITLTRIALGAVALALVPRARKAVERRHLPRIAFLGVTWMGVPALLFPVAQQWIDSSVAGMLNGSVPLATALWSVLLLRRLPGPAQRWGLLLGFVGVVAISWPNVRDSTTTALGIGLVMVAVTLYGLATNVAVPLQQRYGALPVLLRVQVVALAVVAPFGLWQLDGSTFAWPSLAAMVPLGVLGTGLAFVAMATLAGRVGGPRASVSIYFVPVVAIVLGVSLRSETLSLVSVAGTAMVLAGAWLISRAEAPRPVPGPHGHAGTIPPAP